jgi:cytochrome c553
MNKNILTVCLALAVAPLAQADAPEPDRALWAAVGFCGDCHGRDGNSISPQFPKLAGQPRKFLEVQIEKMQKHSRLNQAAQDYMWGPAQWLDAATAKAVAAYYSAQKVLTGTVVDRELAARGKAIFRSTPSAKDADACTNCHGDEGVGGGRAPRLAGQHRHYLLRQLAAVEANERQVPDEMHAAVRALGDDERKALAEYLQAL